MNNKKESPRKKRLLLTISVIIGVIYFVWRIFYTMPFGLGTASLVFGLLLLVAELLSSYQTVYGYLQISETYNPPLPELPDDMYPHVDIFIATHNEPTELLYKTLNGCLYLDYPDKSKVHIFLCDDQKRPEMADLAKKLGVNYMGADNQGHAKAGNLNYALARTDSPIVVTFDADMIPLRHFLMRMVPYFFLPKMKQDEEGKWVLRTEKEIDPDFKIGFVQAPQCFYNPDLFQFNLRAEYRFPNEQNYFFREINVARNTNSSVIYAGSNTALSREALKDIGYLATDSITEDFLTGLRLVKKGYTAYAVSECLATGLEPEDIEALIKQRERWARGFAQSVKNESTFSSKTLSASFKFTQFSNYIYWWGFIRRMFLLLIPPMTVLFNITVVKVSLMEMLAIWLPYYLVLTYSTRIMSDNMRTQHWIDVVESTLAPYLTWPLIAEYTGFSQRKFFVTRKENMKAKTGTHTKYGLPHFLLFVVSAWALIVSVYTSFYEQTFVNLFIIAFLLLNIKNALFGMLFMYGRDNNRGGNRVLTNVALKIKLSDGKVIETETINFSEDGMAFVLAEPIYINPDSTLEITPSYKDYNVTLSTKIIYIKQLENGWRYGVQTHGISENSRREYLQIVYDREPTLAEQVPMSAFAFAVDIWRNIQIRMTKLRRSMRKLPRVQLNLAFATDAGETGILKDFNFQYAKLGGKIQLKETDKLLLEIGAGLQLSLKPQLEINGKKFENLFNITNRAELADSKAFADILHGWTKMSASQRKKMYLKAKLITT